MRSMMEDSMGILDYPSESDYPSGNDYETMLYDNTAMPRDSLGDMSQAWKPAAEQSIASLQPFDDFVTADQEVGAPAAWTANSKSITSHASDAGLSGGVFNMAAALPNEVEHQPMNQMVSHTPGSASVELAVTNTIASPVDTAPLVRPTAKATIASKKVSLTRPARSLFKIEFLKFCTDKNIWSPNLVNGGATPKIVDARILQDIDALTKLLHRSMRRLGLSTTNATAASKVQMQLGDNAGGYETVDERGVDRWLAGVCLHEASESDEVPVMKFGWYNYDHRVEATKNW